MFSELPVLTYCPVKMELMCIYIRTESVEFPKGVHTKYGKTFAYYWINGYVQFRCFLNLDFGEKNVLTPLKTEYKTAMSL